jgi:hypothetical protein
MRFSRAAVFKTAATPIWLAFHKNSNVREMRFEEITSFFRGNRKNIWQARSDLN